MNLAGPLEDLDVLFVGDEGFISVAGFFGEVDALHRDDAIEENAAWAFLDDRDKRVVMGICLQSDVRPLAQAARDTFDKLDELARATLAHKYLALALDHDQKTRARITAQLEKLRAELEQTKLVWDTASAKADILIGDRA